jgi:hypothetical protein
VAFEVASEVFLVSKAGLRVRLKQVTLEQACDRCLGALLRRGRLARGGERWCM